MKPGGEPAGARVRPLLGGGGQPRRGQGRGTEAAATSGRPWAAGQAGLGAHSSDPTSPGVTHAPRHRLLADRPPSAPREWAESGRRGARGGGAAFALRARSSPAAWGSRGPRAHSGAATARAALGLGPGRGSGLAPPAQPAQPARHPQSGGTGRARGAEPPDPARKTGARAERRAACGLGALPPRASRNRRLPRGPSSLGRTPPPRGDCGTGRAVPGVWAGRAAGEVRLTAGPRAGARSRGCLPRRRWEAGRGASAFSSPALSLRTEAQSPHCAPTPPSAAGTEPPFTSCTPALVGTGGGGTGRRGACTRARGRALAAQGGAGARAAPGGPLEGRPGLPPSPGAAELGGPR